MWLALSDEFGCSSCWDIQESIYLIALNSLSCLGNAIVMSNYMCTLEGI